MNGEILEEFLFELNELVNKMNKILSEIERGENVEENLKELFRIYHTIKGSAGIVGLTELSKISHKMESLLKDIISGKLSLNDNILSLIYKSLDIFNDLLESREVKDLGSFLEEIERVEKSGFSISKKKYKIEVYVDKNSQMKDVRCFQVIHNLKRIGNIISSNPSLNEIEKGVDFFSIILETDKSIEEVKSALSISEISFDIKEYKDEEKVESKSAERKEEEKKQIKFIKIRSEQLDRLMGCVEELSIAKIRFAHILKDGNLEELERIKSVFDKNISELQRLILEIRLVPLEIIFSKYYRMVREISRNLNKEVNFIIEGENIEIDRSIINELDEALIHLLRNAIDHGIETPEERLRKGKSRKGVVKLIAKREKDYCIITVEDDGKGIDLEKIKKKAYEMGLISDLNIPDEKALELIFMPGFSTKEKATQYSGRGFGLDIVKTRIESLGGKVIIETERDKGTRITLKIPINIAIIKALIVEVSKRKYAVPIYLINEIIKIEDSKVKRVNGAKIYLYRDKTIPIISLKEKLGLINDEREKYLLIISEENKFYGISIDNIYSMEDIVVKNFEISIIDKRESIFSGMTILGSGEIVPILNIFKIVRGE